MNTTTEVRSVGRPEAELKFPSRTAFTVDEAYELNRGPRGRGKKAQICKLTVRKHIEKQLASGFLTKIESLKTGRAGKPANRFIRTAVKAGLEAARAARQVVNETPVSMEIVPTVEVPAVIEIPGAEAVPTLVS